MKNELDGLKVIQDELLQHNGILSWSSKTWFCRPICPSPLYSIYLLDCMCSKHSECCTYKNFLRPPREYYWMFTDADKPICCLQTIYKNCNIKSFCKWKCPDEHEVIFRLHSLFICHIKHSWTDLILCHLALPMCQLDFDILLGPNQQKVKIGQLWIL